MNTKEICINCMEGKLDENHICSKCGADNSKIKNNGKQLPERYVLKGKYLIGKVLGSGGFGITYIAYDLDLEIRVAIKEFYPREDVARDVNDGCTIVPFDKECAYSFEQELEKFIYEAKRLAKFRNEPNVVSVLDYFRENGTAYIVMDYIDGITFRQYVKQRHNKGVHAEGFYCSVVLLMLPIMETLEKIHKFGLVHRDISPDNIMIEKETSESYLIDFGTARDVTTNHSKSVYQKGGYTPIEQQSRSGNQGPWTDVYEICATMYWALTQKDIPVALDRLQGDTVAFDREEGVTVSDYVEKVEATILKGLALYPQNRIQSMGELKTGLIPDKKENNVPEEAVKVEVETKDEVVTIEAAEELKETVEDLEELEETKARVEIQTPVVEEKEIPKTTGKWSSVVITIAMLTLVVLLGYSTYYFGPREKRIDYDDGQYAIEYYDNGVKETYSQYTSDGVLIGTHFYVGEKKQRTEYYSEETGHNYKTQYYNDDESEAEIRYYYYDDLGNMTGVDEMLDGVLTSQTTYEYDGDIRIQNTWDYESEDTYKYTIWEWDMEEGSTRIVEEHQVVDGYYTESIYYELTVPGTDGWTIKNIYAENCKDARSYETYMYDENDIKVSYAKVVNGEQVDFKIYNQKLYNSIDWDARE